MYVAIILEDLLFLASGRNNNYLLASHHKLVTIIILSAHFFCMTLFYQLNAQCVGKSHRLYIAVVAKPLETFFSILLLLFCNILLLLLFCESLFETEKVDNVMANYFLLKVLPPKRDAILMKPCAL